MILALLAILILGPFKPDPALTPGVVRPISVRDLCATKWGKDARHVTLTMRRQIFAAYRIPYEKHALYELDHLVPRELGGEDAVLNLWAQPYEGTWNAHMKDRLENYLHRQVCSGAMSLETAQKLIATDWQRAYEQFLK